MAEGRCIHLTAEKNNWCAAAMPLLGTQLSWGQENKKSNYFKKIPDNK